MLWGGGDGSGGDRGAKRRELGGPVGPGARDGGGPWGRKGLEHAAGDQWGGRGPAPRALAMGARRQGRVLAGGARRWGRGPAGGHGGGGRARVCGCVCGEGRRLGGSPLCRVPDRGHTTKMGLCRVPLDSAHSKELFHILFALCLFY